MTPEQALQILDSACAQIHLNRQDHATIQQAIAVLAEAIKTKDYSTGE